MNNRLFAAPKEIITQPVHIQLEQIATNRLLTPLIELSTTCSLSAGTAASLTLIQQALYRNGISVKHTDKIIDVLILLAISLRGHSYHALALTIADMSLNWFTKVKMPGVIRDAARIALFATSPDAGTSFFDDMTYVLAGLSSYLAERFTLFALYDFWDDTEDTSPTAWRHAHSLYPKLHSSYVSTRLQSDAPSVTLWRK
jgi:hypothetical protein